MEQNDTKRISRLTAILTRLQNNRLVTASELSSKFAVSIRTIYRDMRALEQAGIPIVCEEGKGYTIMDHYSLPPVAFTENEANALITAEQLVLKTKDSSFIAEYAKALEKITAVLTACMKDRVNLLAQRTRFTNINDIPRTSQHLSTIQFAITHYRPLRIKYTNEQKGSSTRTIEPFALLSTENWLLIAYCHLRKGFRYFRLDRIQGLEILPDAFTPHGMTLQMYFERYHGTSSKG